MATTGVGMVAVPPVTTTDTSLFQYRRDPSLHFARALTHLPEPPPEYTVPIFEFISCHLPSFHFSKMAMPTCPAGEPQLPLSHQPWPEASPLVGPCTLSPRAMGWHCGIAVAVDGKTVKPVIVPAATAVLTSKRRTNLIISTSSPGVSLQALIL